jgi:hypothetical protein
MTTKLSLPWKLSHFFDLLRFSRQIQEKHVKWITMGRWIHIAEVCTRNTNTFPASGNKVLRSNKFTFLSFCVVVNFKTVLIKWIVWKTKSWLEAELTFRDFWLSMFQNKFGILCNIFSWNYFSLIAWMLMIAFLIISFQLGKCLTYV